jgi:hypothetical protein
MAGFEVTPEASAPMLLYFAAHSDAVFPALTIINDILDFFRSGWIVMNIVLTTTRQNPGSERNELRPSLRLCVDSDGRFQQHDSGGEVTPNIFW